jgi:hypothetical protein
MNWVDQRNTEREYEVYFVSKREDSKMLPLTSCPSSSNAGSETPPNTITPQSTWFFAISLFAFKVFVGFQGVEYRERKVALRTVRALVTKKRKHKRIQTQSWRRKINVRADKMLGKESVRKALTFCTLHINNFQKD